MRAFSNPKGLHGVLCPSNVSGHEGFRVSKSLVLSFGLRL